MIRRQSLQNLDTAESMVDASNFAIWGVLTLGEPKQTNI